MNELYNEIYGHAWTSADDYLIKTKHNKEKLCCYVSREYIEDTYGDDEAVEILEEKVLKDLCDRFMENIHQKAFFAEMNNKPLNRFVLFL